VCSAHLRFAGLDQQSGLAPGIMDGRPHLFYNLPLPPQLLHQYQVILLGDRGTWVWTTCPESLRSSTRPWIEPMPSWSQVQTIPLCHNATHMELDCIWYITTFFQPKYNFMLSVCITYVPCVQAVSTLTLLIWYWRDWPHPFACLDIFSVVSNHAFPFFLWHSQITLGLLVWPCHILCWWMLSTCNNVSVGVSSIFV